MTGGDAVQVVTFGIGSEIYRPGQSVAETSAKAAALVEAARGLR